MTKTDTMPESEAVVEIEDEDIITADEHQIYLNVMNEFEEAKTRRNKYKKYGPLVVVITGIVFLSLMFTRDSKIEFLILWVATIILCVALMVKAEYRYHRFRVILGIDKNAEGEESEEDFEEPDENSEEPEKVGEEQQ